MDTPDRPAPARYLGLDLGATNLKWAVVASPGDSAGDSAGEDWSTLARGEVATRIGPDPETVPDAVVAQLVEVAGAAQAHWGPLASAGIGVPGRYDPAAGTIRFLVNLPGRWAGRAVGGPVAAAIERPAFVLNDARAFGLAELRLGAGRGAASMVGITLGTGVGGVLVIDGKVHLGHDGSAGEVGHQTIEPDGPWCQCGNRGCLEAYVRADQIAQACGTATAEAAVLAAQAGDESARAGLAGVGRYLGIGLANLISLLTPDRIVVGGGVAAAGEWLLGPARAEIARRVRMTDVDAVTIVPAELGTWAGAIGAAIHGAEQLGPTAR